MKKSLFGILFIVLFINGCIRPLARFKKAQDKTVAITKKIDDTKNNLQGLSKQYVYGAEYSLSLSPAPDKYNLLSREFLDKSLVITGEPTLQEVNELKIIITNLLSTNALIRAQGVKLSNEKDQQGIKLQSKVDSLEKDLEKQEIKDKAINEANAVWANKWTRMISWIKWIGIFIIGGFILNTIAVNLPPPYNSIAAIFGLIPSLFVRFIHAVMPNVHALAGTVSQEVHNETKTALNSIVTDINQIKASNPDTYKTVIQPVLNQSAIVTSPITNTVSTVKTDLKLV